MVGSFVGEGAGGVFRLDIAWLSLFNHLLSCHKQEILFVVLDITSKPQL